MIPSIINESTNTINIEENPTNFSLFFNFEKPQIKPIILNLEEDQDFVHICPNESTVFEIELPSFEINTTLNEEIVEKTSTTIQSKHKTKIELKLEPKKIEPPSSEINQLLNEEIIGKTSDIIQPKRKTKIELKLEPKPKKIEENKDLAYLIPLKASLLEEAKTYGIQEKSIQTITPIFSAIEKTIILQEKHTSLSLIQSITYVRPQSKLNGLEIQLEFFDTNPKSIGIEFIGNSEAVKLLSSELKNLELCLKKRFEMLEFPKISLSLTPIFPTPFYQQKSSNRLSKKKEAEGKIVFKPIKETLCC